VFTRLGRRAESAALGQLRSVALTLDGDEPRFLQWTKSVGLARVEEYRDYVAKCAA